MTSLRLSEIPLAPTIDQALEVYVSDGGTSRVASAGDLRDFIGAELGFSGGNLRELEVNRLDLDATAAPAVSEASTGRIYFDQVLNTFQVSQDGQAYQSLVVDSMGFGQLKASGTNLLTSIQGASLGSDAENALAIGQSALADFDSSIALGNGAQVAGINAIAIGQGTLVSADQELGIGAGGNPVIQAFDMDDPDQAVVAINAGTRLKSVTTGVSETLVTGVSLVFQSAGGITSSLPASPTIGDFIRIKNSSPSANLISGNGLLIEGLTDQSISSGDAYSLVFDGTEWKVV